MLTFIEDRSKYVNGRKRYYALYKCSCGNERVMNTEHVKGRGYNDCKECKRFSLIGKRRGMIQCVGYKGGNVLIKCDCGNKKYIPIGNFELVNSCGCNKWKAIQEKRQNKAFEKLNTVETDIGISFTLSTGETALVSKCDEHILKYSWYKTKRNSVEARIGYKLVKIHRLIMNPKEGMVVDHINGNTLDNRRENLRVCTQKQNSWNSFGYGKLGVKGVSLEKGKFIASITHEGKKIRIGAFQDIESARLEYNKTVVSLRGEYAKIS